VGDEAGSLHDGVCLSVQLGGKTWELLKYFSHFVSSFTATDIDDALRVRVFGKSLRNTCLTATEGTRDSASSTQHRWVHSVQDSLSSKKGLVGLKLLNVWSWGSDWPEVTHAQVNSLSVGCLDSDDWGGHTILTCWLNFNNSALNLRISHNMMLLEKGVLVDHTDEIATGDWSTLLQFLVWLEVPHLVLVQAWQLDTSWDEYTLSGFGDIYQWSLNSVKNCLQNT